MGDRPLYDRALFWVALGGALSVIGGIVLSVGVAQVVADTTHPDLWSNRWFEVGFGAFVVGVLALVWALVLYVAHRHAEQHWCPDPDAHRLTRGQPVAQTPQFIAGLRALRGELTDAAQKVRVVSESGSLSEMRPHIREWKRNRETLIGMTGVNELWDALESAYGQVSRLSALRTDRVFKKYRVEEGDNLEQANGQILGAVAAIDRQLAPASDATSATTRTVSALDQQLGTILDSVKKFKAEYDDVMDGAAKP
jgi:hypothetical protein